MPGKDAEATAKSDAAPSASANATGDSGNSTAVSTDKSKKTTTANDSASFNPDGVLWVELNNGNKTFAQIWKTYTVNLDPDCDPLRNFGLIKNTDGWWEFARYILVKPGLYKPDTKLEAMNLSTNERTNLFYRVITSYLKNQYGSSDSRHTATESISSTRHLIMRTIRDALVKIDHHKKDNTAKLIAHYGYVVDAIFQIKTQTSWKDQSLFKDLFTRAGGKEFYKRLNTIYFALKRLIKKKEAEQDSTVTQDNLKIASESYEEVSILKRDQCFRSIFPDKKIFEDALDHPDHESAFRNMTPLNELVKMDMAQFEETIQAEYDEFKGNTAIHESTRDLFYSAQQLFMVKVLFFMAEQERKVMELEAVRTRDEVQDLIEQAEEFERNQMLSGNLTSDAPPLLPGSASEEEGEEETQPGGTLVDRKGGKTQSQLELEYKQLDERRRTMILELGNILPAVFQKALGFTGASEASAQNAAKDYLISCQQSLESYFHTISLRGIMNSLQQIMIGVGNFAKPSALEEFETLCSRGISLAHLEINLQEKLQEVNGSFCAHVSGLDEQWTDNFNHIAISSKAIIDTLKGKTLPALNKLHNSLSRDNIMRDMFRTVAAFESLHARLHLMGVNIQPSPFYQAFKKMTIPAIIAAKKERDGKKEEPGSKVDNPYLEFVKGFSQASTKRHSKDQGPGKKKYAFKPRKTTGGGLPPFVPKTDANLFTRFTQKHPGLWAFIKYFVIPLTLALLLVFTGGVAAAIGIGLTAAGKFAAVVVTTIGLSLLTLGLSLLIAGIKKLILKNTKFADEIKGSAGKKLFDKKEEPAPKPKQEKTAENDGEKTKSQPTSAKADARTGRGRNRSVVPPSPRSASVPPSPPPRPEPKSKTKDTAQAKGDAAMPPQTPGSRRPSADPAAKPKNVNTFSNFYPPVGDPYKYTQVLTKEETDFFVEALIKAIHASKDPDPKNLMAKILVEGKEKPATLNTLMIKISAPLKLNDGTTQMMNGNIVNQKWRDAIYELTRDQMTAATTPKKSAFSR